MILIYLGVCLVLAVTEIIMMSAYYDAVSSAPYGDEYLYEAPTTLMNFTAICIMFFPATLMVNGWISLCRQINRSF